MTPGVIYTELIADSGEDRADDQGYPVPAEVLLVNDDGLGLFLCFQAAEVRGLYHKVNERNNEQTYTDKAKEVERGLPLPYLIVCGQRVGGGEYLLKEGYCERNRGR